MRCLYENIHVIKYSYSYQWRLCKQLARSGNRTTTGAHPCLGHAGEWALCVRGERSLLSCLLLLSFLADIYSKYL